MKYESVVARMIDKGVTPSYCAKRLHMELKDFVGILEHGEFTVDQVEVLQDILQFKNPMKAFYIG